MTEKPLEEIDKLKLENLHLRTAFLNLKGELDATKTKMELDKAVGLLNDTFAEMQKKYETEGWELDLTRGKWVKKED